LCHPTHSFQKLAVFFKATTLVIYDIFLFQGSFLCDLLDKGDSSLIGTFIYSGEERERKGSLKKIKEGNCGETMIRSNLRLLIF
jgi:hypothetical protein